ncbi:MAG TPA: hypothetical protein VHK91_01765 [Flavisolibacter sp.]|jgi:hypothetical protein|nr:hypothetical protein [Flavisolibacter sp.]
MKKYILVAAVTLFTTAAVTATVAHNSQKKPVKKTNHCNLKKGHCPRMSGVACY